SGAPRRQSGAKPAASAGTVNASSGVVLAIIRMQNAKDLRCQSTNTSATIAKLNSKKSSSTANRKSPAPTALREKPPSSFLSSVRPSQAAPPNPPPVPLAEAVPAAAAGVAVTKFVLL